MATKLEEIITTVNAELTGYCRWMIQPSDMGETRNASCFGRVATIGAALCSSGVPDEALTLLISRNHAMEFRPGRGWLGHAVLVANVDGGVLVDAPAYTAHTRNIGAISWPGSLAGDNHIEVIDREAAPKYTQQNWDEDPYLSYIYGEWDIYYRQPIFTAHPFTQGIEQYQALHPELRTNPRAHTADYADFYESLTI